MVSAIGSVTGARWVQQASGLFLVSFSSLESRFRGGPVVSVPKQGCSLPLRWVLLSRVDFGGWISEGGSQAGSWVGDSTQEF